MDKYWKRSVEIDDIDSIIDKINLIDIREPYEYEDYSIKTAKNIPMKLLLAQPEKYLNKDKEYYILCEHAVRSSSACYALDEMGYNVVNVLRGMSEYYWVNSN